MSAHEQQRSRNNRLREHFATLGWVTRRLGAVAVVVVMAYVFAVSFNNSDQIHDLKNQKAAAQNSAQKYSQAANAVAQDVNTACKQVRSLGHKCSVPPPDQTIKQITGKQGLPGLPGKNGANGRGITSTHIDSDGDLIVTYTDGSTYDAGHVQGKAGSAGPGGRSITDTALSGRDLILVFSDGTSRDVGQVVGEAGKNGTNGKNGANGANGRSVTSVLAVAGHLLVTYSDGTSSNAGDLPPGPQGPPGRGIDHISYDATAGDLTITFTDGTTAGPFHTKGADGAPGTNGTNGTDGKDGAPGKDGTSGVDGQDGYPPASWTFTDATGTTYTCTPNGNAGPGTQPSYSCAPSTGGGTTPP